VRNHESLKRGEIVVVQSPHSDENLIKRIIGLPGDVVRVPVDQSSSPQAVIIKSMRAQVKRNQKIEVLKRLRDRLVFLKDQQQQQQQTESPLYTSIIDLYNRIDQEDDGETIFDPYDELHQHDYPDFEGRSRWTTTRYLNVDRFDTFKKRLNLLSMKDMLVMIPIGFCWIQGDNKEVSNDSRSYGLVPFALVKGRLSFFGFHRDQYPPFPPERIASELEFSSCPEIQRLIDPRISSSLVK